MPDPERLETEEKPPAFMPTQKLWKRCIGWGKARNFSAREVYQRLVGGGEVLARIEESGDGEVVWKRSNGTEVPIKVLDNHKNGNTNNSST